MMPVGPTMSFPTAAITNNKPLLAPATTTTTSTGKLAFSIDAIVGQSSDRHRRMNHHKESSGRRSSSPESGRDSESPKHRRRSESPCPVKSTSSPSSDQNNKLRRLKESTKLKPSDRRSPSPSRQSPMRMSPDNHLQANSFAAQLHHFQQQQQQQHLQSQMHLQHNPMMAALAFHHQQQQQQQQQQHPMVAAEYHQALYPWLFRGPNPMPTLGGRFHPFDGGIPSFLLPPFRKPKRIRTAFSPGQLLKLEQAFEKNHYVVGNERKLLASNLGLSETQVKVWFQNRRTKHKRQKQEEEQCNSNTKDGEDRVKSGDDTEDEELDLDDDDDNREVDSDDDSDHRKRFSSQHHRWSPRPSTDSPTPTSTVPSSSGQAMS